MSWDVCKDSGKSSRSVFPSLCSAVGSVAGDETSFCYVGLAPFATGMTNDRQKPDLTEIVKALFAPWLATWK